MAGLGSGESGLTTVGAQARLGQYGPNRLPTAGRDPWYKRLWHHLSDVLMILLIVAAIIKALMGDWIDFFVILAVIVLNLAIGMIQEGKAEKALDAIKGMLSLTALTCRDGHWEEIDSETLVPGDLIRVKPGDKVPADARLIEATNLQVEESALTGESVASVKTIDSVGPDVGVGDRTSMLFSSTLVVAGTGLAVVTATGQRTEIGHIQEMIADAETLDTPLTKAMVAFGKTLAVIILALAGIMALIGWFGHGLSGNDLVSAAVAFAVATIPEGLPALVTITLALGVSAMARRNAISRQMAAVESIGSVSTICSDKTGTLTQNEMTVREAVTRHATYDVSGTGYAPMGDVSFVDYDYLHYHDGPPSGETADIRALAQVMTLCNDANVVKDDDGRWRLIGEPTEGAVLVFGRKAGAITAGWKRVAEIPFDSATKYMATISEDPDGDRWVFVKGALDAVLPRCVDQIGPDGRSLEPLDAEYWEVQMEHLAAQGLRILAAARHDIADNVGSFDELPQDARGGPGKLTLVGLCGIVDPPRPEAIQAIADARNAGIAVSMITGDHVDTAKAIAYEMGLVDEKDAPTLTGKQLEAMSDAELAAVVQNVHVYARTSPEHKIRIVRALQSHGEVVAMTGDGVNDAPALTQADVGVAMGIKGTEATKEAANIVLADDNFATIERAIAEGRRIYDNIRKAILFMLPTNGAQGLVLLAAIVLGWAFLPMRPVQVLWINMVTSVTLSLPLAMEPAEDGVMSRPPRDPRAPLISKSFLLRVLAVSALLGLATIAVFQWALNWAGLPLAQAQTAAVTMLALGQVAYLFSCRFQNQSSITTRVFYNNPILWQMLAALVVLQLIFIYAPFMHGVFQSAAIGWRVWLLSASLALLLFLAVEAIKALGRRLNPPIEATAVRR